MNVKFLIEGMEETGSNGLDVLVKAERNGFFSDVDYIVISDCGWKSARPALTYGTRGNCYFYAQVSPNTLPTLIYCRYTNRSDRVY